MSPRAWVLVGLCVASLGLGEWSDCQNCGIDSVVGLAGLLGRDLTEQDRRKVAEALPGPTVDMLQIQEAARLLGLDLRGVEASVDALMGGTPGPSIVHLRNPDHFVVLIRASETWAQLMDGGNLAIRLREYFDERYTGRALVPGLPTTDNGPRLELADFHYETAIAGIGQTIEHVFEMRNAGNRGLELQVKDCPG
jgi:ABC-type bacteriocin/lantibiotic exporter with double-glycine peptidase domain